MRKIIIALATAFFIGTTFAQAQENSFYIDLSVLNSIDEHSVMEPAAPQFPIVKDSSKKAVTSKKIVKKNKKIAPKTVQKTTQKPLSTTEKTHQPKPIPYVDNAEDVIVVDVEPVVSNNVTEGLVFQTPETSQTKTEPKDKEPTELNNVASQKEKSENIIKEASNNSLTEKTSTIEPLSEQKNEKSKDISDNKQPLLIETENALPSAVNPRIVFAEDETSLSDAQKSQIDNVINSFSDPENNKIAIYSYNLDDGVDTFRKKRQSLNRAVEIRSYLLQKGFKNFSIKVLNIDTASDKINSVELEELK